MVRRRACWAALVILSASSRMIILCLFSGVFEEKQKEISKIKLNIHCVVVHEK